jgi:hypothetical protein
MLEDERKDECFYCDCTRYCKAVWVCTNFSKVSWNRSWNCQIIPPVSPYLLPISAPEWGSIAFWSITTQSSRLSPRNKAKGAIKNMIRRSLSASDHELRLSPRAIMSLRNLLVLTRAQGSPCLPGCGPGALDELKECYWMVFNIIIAFSFVCYCLCMDHL